MSVPAQDHANEEQKQQAGKDQVASSSAAADAADADQQKSPESREVHSWRFPLQKWRNENRDREYSPEFTLDGESWRILVFPKGNPNHSVQGCMAAYLELRSERAYYSSVCHFKMQMVHPTEPNKYVWRDSTHTFTHTEIDRGFNDLLTPATLADYTHDDGCVVLSVQAWKAPPGFKMPPPLKPSAPIPRGRAMTEIEQIHLAALDEEDRLAVEALFEQDRVQVAAAAQARQLHRRPQRALADSESEGEDEDEGAAEEAHADRSKAALEARLAAIVDSDADQDHSGLSDDAACHVCMERPKRTLTVCCAVVGVCTICMKRLLLLQCAGSSSAKCPNCNVAECKGKPFGIDAVVFNVKT